MPNPRFKVIAQAEGKNFVGGRTVDVVTVTYESLVLGLTGAVVIPQEEYSPERVRKAIEEKLDLHEAVAEL